MLNFDEQRFLKIQSGAVALREQVEGVDVAGEHESAAREGGDAQEAAAIEPALSLSKGPALSLSKGRQPRAHFAS